MKILFLLSVFVGSPVWAQGRKPAKTNSQSDKPAHPVKNLKDGANRGLNDLDSGIHKALPVAKDGANKALNAIDHGVHKVVGSD